jgi:plasmid stabilization system protein ParE
MSQVDWTKTALADVQRHFEALEQVNRTAAIAAVQAIRKTGDSLQNHPQRGAVVHEATGLRKLWVAFGKSGFVIHYAVLEGEVVILRVYHGRENRPS